MTAKEKALQLIGKMCGNNCTETNINRMITPALIAVDEIIENNSKLLDGLRYHEELNYWQEVKDELTNI